MKLDKYLLLSWTRVLIIACAWVLSVLLHNLIYGLFYDYFRRTGGDEPIFFILAVIVVPLYFMISLLYTVVSLVRSRVS
jgi:hypothetical protein